MNALAPQVENDTTNELPLAPPANAAPALALISDAIQKGLSIEHVRELRALAKDIQADEARRAFDRAVAEAKAKIPPIRKNRRVRFDSKRGGTSTDYQYEDFAEVARTIDPHLAAVGLSYRHRSRQDGNKLTVTCILAHRDGHFEETSLTAENDSSGNKNPIQGIGSTATFLQRYTLKLALGLAAAPDDDGRSSDPATEPDTVSDEQVEMIKKLIDEAVEARPGTDRAEWIELFLQYMRVDGLNDIPAKEFDRACAAIRNAMRHGGKQ